MNERMTGGWGLGTSIFTQHSALSTFKSGGNTDSCTEACDRTWVKNPAVWRLELGASPVDGKPCIIP
ncbi:hypothetical protein [Nostoc sp.]|uniref:hypothetical protein n=1 Tax=Nostoc sp. TaxID=1180 RepID=UPI002FF867AF